MKAKIIQPKTLQAKLQEPRSINAIMRGGLVIHENIELSKQGEYICWRTVGKLEWRNLIAISELSIKGDTGDKGDNGYTPIKGIDYVDGKDGKDGKDGIGKNGKDGVDGKDGLSAYEIWKLDNPNKTQDDFWKWLRREGEHIIMTGAINVVPSGGATGQVLKKRSNTDYDLEWGTGGGGSGIVETIVAGSNITVDATDPANPIVSATSGGGGAVDSVNGQTGVVVLDADDIDDTSTTNKFVTAGDLTKLGNLSGTNTGDQDLSPYFNKGVDDTDDITEGTTKKFTTSSDISKLAGIEALADVTDATNVGAAGAFMKSVDDTDDITVGTTNKFATAAEKTKLGFISVTQNVDLDAIETNANNVPGIKTKTDFITVTQAVDLDTIETNANNVPGIKTKTDFITVTQVVNLDTIESDTATNNAKVTNATHTGEMIGATVLTADPTLVSNKTLKSTLAGTEEVLINDSGTLKKTTAQDIADLGGGGGTTDYDALSNKPITNLVGTIGTPIDLDTLTTVGTYRISGNVTSTDGALVSLVDIYIALGDYYISILDTGGADRLQVYHLLLPSSYIQRDYIASVWSAIYHNNYIIDDGAGNVTLGGNLTVADEAYDATAWNGNLSVPTKNAIRDKIESLSGVTDGDKGDIAVSASGATWTIDNDVVTFAKMQNISTNKLLGRGTAATGDVEEITLGTGLTLSGTTLNATAGSALSATYTLSNVTTDRTLDANSTSLDELADVLGTVINDMTQYIGYDANQIRIRIPGELIQDTSNYQGIYWRNTTGASITVDNVAIGVGTAAAGAGAACSVNVYKSSGTSADGLNTNAVNLFTSSIALGTGYTSDTNTPNTATVESGRWVTLRITSSAGATNKASDLECIISYS